MHRMRACACTPLATPHKRHVRAIPLHRGTLLPTEKMLRKNRTQHAQPKRCRGDTLTSVPIAFRGTLLPTEKMLRKNRTQHAQPKRCRGDTLTSVPAFTVPSGTLQGVPGHYPICSNRLSLPGNLLQAITVHNTFRGKLNASPDSFY